MATNSTITMSQGSCTHGILYSRGMYKLYEQGKKKAPMVRKRQDNKNRANSTRNIRSIFMID